MTCRLCTFGRWVAHTYQHCCMKGFLGIFELSYMKNIRSTVNNELDRYKKSFLLDKFSQIFCRVSYRDPDYTLWMPIQPNYADLTGSESTALCDVYRLANHLSVEG
jgi:hypothetical protein